MIHDALPTQLPPSILVTAGLNCLQDEEISGAGATLLRRAEAAEPGVVRRYVEERNLSLESIPELTGMFEGKL